MYGSHFQFFAQLCLNRRHLIPIWRDNADTLIPLFRQTGKYLLPDYIDLSLIQMITGMVAGCCPVHGQHIGLLMVLRHDNELPTVELLITEIDDFGMATIVFSQENCGSLRPCGDGGGEQTVSREMVWLWEGIPLPDVLAFLNILTVQHIRELLEISYDDDVFGTGKGEDTSGQIHLRGFIHDEIIVDMFKVQGALDRVSRTQDYWIFMIEFFGSCPEIPHFKALAGLLPMELFA